MSASESHDIITKTKLAQILGVTPRSVTNYMASGLLPAATRIGRNSAWALDELVALASHATPEARNLPPKQLARLQAHIDDLVERPLPKHHSVAEVAGLVRLPVGEAVGPRGWEHSRAALERTRRSHKDGREHAAQMLRQGGHSTGELQDLWSERRFHAEAVEHAEASIQADFIYEHFDQQLLGTRQFFNTPLFNACQARAMRNERIQLTLAGPDKSSFEYEGPELRQEDGLVFMALLNVARDLRLGREVSFSPKGLCECLWGRYDGPVRNRLKRTISRLQEGLVRFPAFRIQLVGRFSFPRSGPWSIAMDPELVNLFTRQNVVWLDLHTRLAIKSGVPAWLYAYVEAQSKLIPTAIAALHKASGVRISLDEFRKDLPAHLRLLVEACVIDGAWRIAGDQVRWRKAKRLEQLGEE